MTTLKITSFRPLAVQLPEVKEIPDNVVEIYLPEINTQIFDLSMGGIIPGRPGFYAPVEIGRIVLQLDPDTTVGQVIDTILDAKAHFEKTHQDIEAVVRAAEPIVR